MSQLVLKRYRVVKKKSRKRFALLVVPALVLILVFSALTFVPGGVKAQDDYTFGTELVNKGYSVNPTGKNSEDGTFETLTEADQYPDTNFSETGETIVTGTAGGTAPPGSLNTDDSTYRTYQEANSVPANYVVYMRPSADSAVSFATIYPTSPTTHYDKVYEATAGGNGATNYIQATATTQSDIFTMSTIATPSGSPSYAIRMWAVCEEASSGNSNIAGAIGISSTYYSAFSVTPATTWTNYSGGWTTNPAGGSWTLAAVNALTTKMTTATITKNPQVTQVGIMVYVNYTASYTAEAQLWYNATASTAQTTGWYVQLKGMISGSESFYCQNWNYTSSAWETKATISSVTNTLYNYNLPSTDRDGTNNIIRFRFIDAGGDATQDTVSIDLLLIERIELGYALDVELTATSVAQYGNITLRIKGYTTGEAFNINIYNYTASSYDLNWMSIVNLTNTWCPVLNLNDTTQRSGTSVKIQIVDATPAASDQVQDSLYLDVAWTSRYRTAPTLTLFGCQPTAINIGETAYFWDNYTSYDNQAPSTIYTHIGSTDYAMAGNDSGDTSYFNGKNYSYSTSALTAGNWTYYFTTNDGYTGAVQTTSAVIAVNTKPTLTLDGVTPAEANAGTFTFYVTYTDADSNSPQYVQVTIAGVDYSMTYNGTGGGYHYDKTMGQGSYTYSFKTADWLSGNVATTPKSLTVHGSPTITLYGANPSVTNFGEPIVFFMNYTDVDNDAPSANYPKVHIDSTDYTMTKNNSGDNTYNNGCNYSYSKSDLAAGSHTYYFVVKDAYSPEVQVGSAQVNVNRLPTLSGDTVNPLTGNNGQSFQFQVVYTDLDNNAPSYIYANIDTVDYAMTKDNGGDNDYTDGCAYHYDKVMAGGSHPYYFRTSDGVGGNVQTTGKNLAVNNIPTLSNFGRAPADPVYVTTTLNFTVTFTDLDNDLPSVMNWREGGGAIQNLSMGQVDPTDTTTTDGKVYYKLLTLGHGAHSFDFYASDGMGGVSGGSDSVTIANRNPSITNGPSNPDNEYRNQAWSYSFTFTDLDGDSVSWAESGASWLTMNPATGYLSGTTSNTPGTYPITVYANDSYGGTTNYQFNMVITNRAPTITNGPGASVNEWRNTYWSYDFNYNDADGDTITFGAARPAWLSIDSGSGILSGTTTNTPGDYSITVYANDSYGGSANYPFTMHILNRNPTITDKCSANPTAYRNVAWSFDFNGTDPDTDTITWGRAGAGWLTMNSASGILSGTTTNAPGDYVFTVYANDSYGGQDSYAFTLTLQNRNPTVTDTCGSNPVAYRNVAWSFDFNATDPDTDTLNWARTGPSWLTIDSGTGILSGTTSATPGNFGYTVYANDSYGGSSSFSFTLSIINQAPTITDKCSATPSAYRNIAWSFDFNATDADSDTVTWQRTGAAWLTIDSGTGILSGTTSNTPATYQFIVYANDSYGGSSSYWFNLTVQDRAPTITNGPGASVNAWRNTAWYYVFTYNDADGDTCTWSKNFGPAWLTIDSVTGNLSGTMADTPGACGFQVKVNDGYGKTATYTFTLNVLNRNPSITSNPGDPSTWRNTFWWWDFTASDPDTDSISWAKTGPAWLTIAGNGNLSGTAPDAPGDYGFVVYANDSYGGSANYSFTLHVVNAGLTITNGPGTDPATYRSTLWWYDFTATDGPTWAYQGPAYLSINPSTGNLSGTVDSNLGTFLCHVWANDTYGASSEYNFTLHVNNRAPSITSYPSNPQSAFRNVAWSFNFGYSDPDGDSVNWASNGVAWLSINGAGVLSGTTTDTPGSYTVNVWANDSYGGSATYQFTLNINNRIPAITSTGNTTIAQYSFMAYHVIASDADGDGLTYGFTTDAPFLSLSNGWVNGSATVSGSFEYTVWANDSYGGSTSEHEFLEVSNSNLLPSFTSTPIYFVANNTYYSYDANATDPELDTLVYGLDSDNSYLSIDSSSGVVSGTPHHAGDFYVHISVNDGTNPLVWQNYTLHVTSAPPSFTSIPTYSVANNSAYYYDANAVDPEGEGLYYDLSGTCLSFLSIDHVTGIIQGTPHSVGSYTVKLMVSDYTNIVWQNYSLEVTTTAPSFTSTQIESGQNQSAYSYHATATDPESEPLYFDLSGSCTSFLSIDHTTGWISGSIPLVGSWDVQVMVTDYSFVVWQNFTLSGLNTAPTIITTPSTSGAINETYSYTANATDPNGDTLQWNVLEKPAWLGVDLSKAEFAGKPTLAGDYSVQLLVWDGYSYAYQNWSIHVPEPGSESPPVVGPPPPNPQANAPQAFFKWTLIGDKLIVESKSTGTITKLQWSFGDGFGGQASKDIHQYALLGNYSVTLTVWNGDHYSTATVVIHVTTHDSSVVQKGEAGWVVRTPAGSFNINATACLMAGLVVLLVSFSGRPFPIVRSKYARLIGAGLVIIGALFYLM